MYFTSVGLLIQVILILKNVLSSGNRNCDRLCKRGHNLIWSALLLSYEVCQFTKALFSFYIPAFLFLNFFFYLWFEWTTFIGSTSPELHSWEPPTHVHYWLILHIPLIVFHKCYIMNHNGIIFFFFKIAVTIQDV